MAMHLSLINRLPKNGFSAHKSHFDMQLHFKIKLHFICEIAKMETVLLNWLSHNGKMCYRYTENSILNT